MTTLTSTPRSSAEVATPVRPILRKPVTVLGTRAREDSEDELQPPSTKRRKTVMFDESLNMTRDIVGRSLDEVKREVKEALDRHERGDDEDYDTLKEVFTNDQNSRSSQAGLGEDGEDEDVPSPSDLLAYIVALTSHVPMLGRSCSGLVKSVLKCQWLARDEVFAKAFVQFLAALSSAQGSYLVQVLATMVDQFSETRSPPSVPGYPAVGRESMRQRLHLGLRYILSLFPGARSIVLNLIATKFPYPEDSKKVHVAYVDNLLRLREYSPDPRDIMELITSRVVKLDVEMQLDLEDMDDETTAAVMLQLKSSEANGQCADDEGDDSDAESVVSDDSDADEQLVRVSNIKNSIEKLDSLLDTLFATYEPYFSDPDSAEAIECYEDMLSDFSNIVLPTYKSRHSQFLVFFFAQKSKRLTEMFVGTLFNIAFESNRPSIVKQSAVAYLASFVARGARVDAEQVQTIARTLLNYMDYHRANYEPECRGPDLRRYAQFYALSQGLLYLFCFRWRDLVNLDMCSPRIDREDPASFLGHDLQWIDGFRTRLQNNIYSKLNPLKVCSPVIVSEFARLAHHLGLMYVYPRLESNKSIHLSQFVAGAYSTGGALRDTGYDPQDDKWTHLDPYCPFDPYQLPLSRRRLDEAETYIPWTSIPGLSRDDEDNESDDGGLDNGEEDVDDILEDTATDEETAYD